MTVEPAISGRTVLSQQNAVAMIIYLSESGGSAKISYIRHVIPNYASVKTIAAALAEEGIIEIIHVGGKNAHLLCKLTPLGEDIAKDLRRANARLAGTLPADEETNHGASMARGGTIKRKSRGFRPAPQMREHIRFYLR